MPTSKCSGHSTRCSSGTCGANRRNAWSPRKKHSARYAAAALSTSSTSSAGTPEPSLYRSSGLPAAIPSIAASSAQVRSEIPIRRPSATSSSPSTATVGSRIVAKPLSMTRSRMVPVRRYCGPASTSSATACYERRVGERFIRPSSTAAPAAPEAGSGGSRKASAAAHCRALAPWRDLVRADDRDLRGVAGGVGRLRSQRDETGLLRVLQESQPATGHLHDEDLPPGLAVIEGHLDGQVPVAAGVGGRLPLDADREYEQTPGRCRVVLVEPWREPDRRQRQRRRPLARHVTRPERPRTADACGQGERFPAVGLELQTVAGGVGRDAEDAEAGLGGLADLGAVAQQRGSGLVDPAEPGPARAVAVDRHDGEDLVACLG